VIEAKLRRWAAIDSMLASDLVRKNLVGRSRAWLDALEQLVEIALFSTKSVLITGESGTGKEMAARLVHTLDQRADKGKLVTLDCTTIVPSLSGSELFGHAKGAFTGASSDRRGAFALAHRGTLFLDEVGELPAHLQSELLRVVQEGSYKPVGSDRWDHTEFRLVCATNRDLQAMQAIGAFRSDLYHRITATVVRLPSLGDRVADLLPLASHFLNAELGDDAPPLSPMVESYLVGRDYPGNVRDLKQLIARMCCRHVGPGPLTVGDIPEDERPQGDPSGWWSDVALVAAVERAIEAGAPLRELKETVAELAVDAALATSDGNVALAARRLQVTERAVQMRRAARKVAEVPAERRLSVMA
jgi:transcriptional regulator with GAF, ATPase, and Fis domain